MIGKKLKQLRKKSDLTQVDVAKKLEVTQPLIQRWESGNKIPNLKTLKKFSKIYNISIDALAFDEKDLADLKDKNLVDKIKSFSKLSEQDKQTVANLIESLSAK